MSGIPGWLHVGESLETPGHECRPKPERPVQLEMPEATVELPQWHPDDAILVSVRSTGRAALPNSRPGNTLLVQMRDVDEIESSGLTILGTRHLLLGFKGYCVGV